MKVATLVYVREAGRTLMLHRVKKPQDMHAGKWVGLGGKLEQGESPEACAIREVQEESGLTICNPVLRGVLTFPEFTATDDWLAFVYEAHTYTGSLLDSAEGVLQWVADDALLDLPMWQGDRVFLHWLRQPGVFSGRLWHEGETLARWEVTFYGENGEILRQESNAPTTVANESAGVAAPLAMYTPAQVAQEADAAHRYTPADDGYCWLCGSAVDKRNCKIICRVCGFMRDCSDP